MNIGPFEDFVATLTPDMIEKIADDANQKASQMRSEGNPTSNDYLGNQIAAVALTLSIELLRLYHKWLEQQNSD